jgi:hypothetical protein
MVKCKHVLTESYNNEVMEVYSKGTVNYWYMHDKM